MLDRKLTEDEQALLAARAFTRRPRRASSTELTEAERCVAVFLARGEDNKAIAQELKMQLPTLKGHVHHIFLKLGVKNRTQAALKLSAEHPTL